MRWFKRGVKAGEGGKGKGQCGGAVVVLCHFFVSLPLASASGPDIKNVRALAQGSVMPFVKVWIHFVWSTKNREPFLTDGIRQKVFQHVRENASEKEIYLDTIGGYVDHVHCLISLGTDQTIEKIMQLIKGESSFWINKNRLVKTR